MGAFAPRAVWLTALSSTAVLELIIVGLLVVIGTLLFYIAIRSPAAPRCCRCGDPNGCPLRQRLGSRLTAGK